MDTGRVTGVLSCNQETDTGPTFPGGLSIWTSQSTGFNLNALLADGAAYYDADGAKIELDASAAGCDGEESNRIIHYRADGVGSLSAHYCPVAASLVDVHQRQNVP